jgi:hypothetical protein
VNDDKHENRLKHIAGLIQKLTFTEMKQLADLLHDNTDTSGRQGIEEELLTVAEKILNPEPAGASL